MSVAVTLLFAWELSHYNLNFGDLRAFTTAWFPPDRYWSAWQVEGLGNFESRPPGDLLVSLCLDFFGSDAGSIFQKLVFLVPYPVSCATMWAFLGLFRVGKFERGFAAFLYAFNPLTLQEMVGGAIGLHWAYMFIPSAGLAVTKIIENTKIGDSLNLGLQLFAASIFLPHAIPFVLGLPMLGCLAPLFSRNFERKRVFRVAGLLAISLVAYTLLLLPSLVSLVALVPSLSFATSCESHQYPALTCSCMGRNTVKQDGILVAQLPRCSELHSSPRFSSRDSPIEES